MFDVGMPELIVIFAVALIVFGPKKLPELGRSLGKGLAELKKAMQDVKDSVEEEFKDSTSDIRGAVNDVKKQIQTEVKNVSKTVGNTVQEAQEQVRKESQGVQKAIEDASKIEKSDTVAGPVKKEEDAKKNSAADNKT
jgi:TatA/E family protein of Tat protein translocase